MAIPDMKWHIFNKEKEPLCWEDSELFFDTEKDAKDFLQSANIALEDVEIKECIFFYDGGHLNATNLRVMWPEDPWGEPNLVDLEYYENCIYN